MFRQFPANNSSALYAISLSQTGPAQQAKKTVNDFPNTFSGKLDYAIYHYFECERELQGVLAKNVYTRNIILNIQTKSLKFIQDVLDVRTKEEAIKRMQARQARVDIVGEEKRERTSLNPSELFCDKFKARFFWRQLKVHTTQHTLSVNLESIANDEEKHYRLFETPEDRDPYRVIISNNLFMRRLTENTLAALDTRFFESHYKKGWGSFVLNTHDELYIFSHLNGDNRMVHSTIMAQKDVKSAGEIQIYDGKLRSITPHSGHYSPTMTSLYETLLYFKSRGVDISYGTVLLFCGDLHQGLKTLPHHYYVDGERKENFVECKVPDFCRYMETHGKTFRMFDRFSRFHGKLFANLIEKCLDSEVAGRSSDVLLNLANDCLDEYLNVHKYLRGKFSKYQAIEEKLVFIAEKYREHVSEVARSLKNETGTQFDSMLSQLSGIKVSRENYEEIINLLDGFKQTLNQRSQVQSVVNNTVLK